MSATKTPKKSKPTAVTEADAAPLSAPVGASVTASDPIDHAFHSRAFQVLVAALAEGILPPRHVAGNLDWKTRGMISRLIKNGGASSTSGETTYVPITSKAMLAADPEPLHVLFTGVGAPAASDGRPSVEAARSALSAAARVLPGMGVKTAGLSRADFADLPEADIRKAFKGIELWIAP